jgi:photosystem II stability/assembly factor-like uncharacterized protein
MRRIPRSVPRHTSIIIAGLVTVMTMLAGPALASGRFPAASAVVFDPHDAKTVYVRATFGLLVTHDGGDSWRWVCERAIGLSGTEDPTYVVTPSGTIVAGTSSGVAVSRDGACTFSLSGGSGTHLLADLTTRQDGEIVAIRSVSSQASPGATLYDDHLVTSKDEARTFTVAGGPIDPTLRLESVRTSESDPARIYVSAVRGEGDKRAGAMLVSYDAGLSWVERKVELGSAETGAVIGMVDPKNADRVYVRTTGALDAKTRLLVTDDAGKTWKKIFDSPSPLLGFALANDGTRVFAGSREGLVSSPTDTFAFTKGSAAEMQCLGLSASALWACSTERHGFLVGVSKSGGRSFDAKLHLDEIRGPLECPPESNVAKQCSTEWPKLRRELGLPEPDEKPRMTEPAGPALRGRAVRTGRAGSSRAAFAGIALLGLAGYFILQRLKRGR